MEIIAKEIIKNVLIETISNLIIKLGNEFKKRPRNATISKNTIPELKKIYLNSYEQDVIVSFLVQDEVERMFYYYIKYRTISSSDTNLDFKVTKEVFLNTCSQKAIDFSLKYYKCNLDNDKLYKLFSIVLSNIEKDIINKIKPEQLFIYNSLANIELLLTDIKSIHLQGKKQKNDFSKYIKNLKFSKNLIHVFGVDKVTLDEFYIEPQLRLSTTRDSSDFKDIKSWKDIFILSNIISLIGGPGYGKSTFVKHLMCNYEKLNDYNANRFVPIYCDLKNYQLFGNGRADYSILEFLYDSMKYETLIGSEITIEGVANELEVGNCLIIFDALDEVSSNIRDELHMKIIAFFTNENLSNKILITSRSRGFIPYTNCVVEIKDMNMHLAKLYVEKISGNKKFNFDKKDVKNFLEQADVLIKNNFLSSFLMLSLVVNVYKSEQELPKTKYLLYSKCINHIVRQRESRDKKTKYNFDNISYILENDLTFEILAISGNYSNENVKEDKILDVLVNQYIVFYGDAQRTYVAVKEFLNFIADRTDFYVKSSPIEDYYKFYHRSFFDYYIAKFLFKSCTNPEILLLKVCEYNSDSEVYELLTEILRAEDLSRYIEFIKLIISSLFNDVNDKKLNYVGLSYILRKVNEKVLIDELANVLDLIILKQESSFILGENIADFANRNNIIDLLIDRLVTKNPIKFYSSFILFILWRKYNQYDVEKRLFSNIGYKLFDAWFAVMIMNHDFELKRNEIPDLNNIMNIYLIYSRELENYTDDIRKIYDYLYNLENEIISRNVCLREINKIFA